MQKPNAHHFKNKTKIISISLRLRPSKIGLEIDLETLTPDIHQ